MDFHTQSVRKSRRPGPATGILETATSTGSSAGASFGDHLGIILGSESSRGAFEGISGCASLHLLMVRKWLIFIDFHLILIDFRKFQLIFMVFH